MTKGEKNKMVSRMGWALRCEAIIVTNELVVRNERDNGGRYDPAIRKFAGRMMVEFVRSIRSQVSSLRKKIKKV